MSASASRAVFAVVGLLVVGVVLYVLFVVSDPIDAFENTGPFEGRVIDAETQKPIDGALVGAGWAGSTFVHGGGCVGGTFTRTDSEGRFRIAWQGMSVQWFLHDRITPGGLTVWAADHRPWSTDQDAPRNADGTHASLPTGSPFLVKNLGDVSLAPKHGQAESDDDRKHLSSWACTGARFELMRSYATNRFAWKQVCGPEQASPVQSEQWLQLANAWKHFWEPSIKPSAAVREQLVEAEKNYDAIDLLLHDRARLKAASELTEDEHRRVCAMLDIRIPELEGRAP